MRARRRLVVDADLAEADPARQALEEAVALGKLAQRRGRARRQQAEVAGVLGDLLPRAPVDQRVEAVHRLAAQERFIVAMRLRGIDDVVAVIDPVRDQFLDQVGGCWPSPSMNSTAPRRAWSSPAISAASLPKLRDSDTTWTSSASAASVRAIASVLSALPSST